MNQWSFLQMQIHIPFHYLRTRLIVAPCFTFPMALTLFFQLHFIMHSLAHVIRSRSYSHFSMFFIVWSTNIIVADWQIFLKVYLLFFHSSFCVFRSVTILFNCFTSQLLHTLRNNLYVELKSKLYIYMYKLSISKSRSGAINISNFHFLPIFSNAHGDSLS